VNIWKPLVQLTIAVLSSYKEVKFFVLGCQSVIVKMFHYERNVFYCPSFSSLFLIVQHTSLCT